MHRDDLWDIKRVWLMRKFAFNASLMSRTHTGTLMPSLVLKYQNCTLILTDDVERGHKIAEEHILRNSNYVGCILFTNLCSLTRLKEEVLLDLCCMVNAQKTRHFLCVHTEQ